MHFYNSTDDLFAKRTVFGHMKWAEFLRTCLVQNKTQIAY